MKDKRPVFLVGDIHGEFSLLKKTLEYYDLKDCYLFSVGDIGMGFNGTKKESDINLTHLNNYFSSRNIVFYGIRGNHDNPSYFDGSVNLSNFKLLKDYSYLELNGVKFGFVGGAISIDRIYRIEGISYWRDENFNLNLDKVQECDILITHSTPTWLGPIGSAPIKSFLDKDLGLWDLLMDERRKHDILVEKSKPKYLFCGHFHESSENKKILEDDSLCIARILDILEIVEVKEGIPLDMM